MTALRHSAFTRALGSLQVRLVLVILLAVLPLAAISSLLAWQSYESVTVLGERRIASMLAGAVARIDILVAATETGETAVLRAPDVSTLPGCDAALRQLTEFAAIPARGVRVLGADGHVVCAVGTDGRPDPAAGRGAAIGTASLDAAGEVLLPIAVRGTAADGTSLTVAADLLLPTGLRSGAAWLLPRNGNPPAQIAGDLPPPRRATLAALRAGSSFVTERGPKGRLRGFVMGRLPDGTPLVIADTATTREARASDVLFWRVAAIGLLLALGVVAVTLGAHLTLGLPIRTLTRRVSRWRAGEAFDETRMPFLPTELADLAHAFGLATTGIVEREAALERARGEQDLLFKEIHHRVKNNLQIIASLLNLQASRIRVPEAKAEFQSARDRVRALATLHRHLYADGGLHTIAMRSFLLELCGQLFQAIGEREGHRIRLDVEASDLQMSSDQAVPLALVVTEAVSNAVKYAFPGGRSGHVSVRLTELPDDMLELVVQDDGVGIPAGRAETETGIRDGLGIQLIRGFARQLGAELVVTEDAGTRYRLLLKLHRVRAEV